MQLLVDLDDRGSKTPPAVMTGPATRPVQIETAAMRRLVGVVFQPGGAAPFLESPVSTLVDHAVPLGELWSREGDVLPDRLADAGAGAPNELARVLTERLTNRASQWSSPSSLGHGWVAAVAQQLAAGWRVREVVEATGWSRATVVRRFRGAVGVSPKRYASLQRFQRAVAYLATSHRDLAEVAVASGYYDQAHFHHEFVRYAGMSPGHYTPRSVDEPNHVVMPRE